MQLDKHPILKQCYDVMQSIEDCGASEKLTHAVTLAGDLMSNINVLVDQLIIQNNIERLIDIDHIKKLNINPTDILLLNVDTTLINSDQVTEMYKHIRTIHNQDFVMVVLDSNSTLESIPIENFYSLLKTVEVKRNTTNEIEKNIEEDHN